MTSSATHAREVERATIELLQQHMKLERVSARELDRRTGMSHHRISKVLRGESSMSIADLATICEGLGLDLARVIRTAESAVEPIKPLEEPGHTIVRVPAPAAKRNARTRSDRGRVRR